jgi:hypothetical protein
MPRIVDAADDDLVVLVLQAALGTSSLVAEQVRFDVEQDPLQPHVEQIRGVGVLDHVVVRRVGDHRVHAGVPVGQGHGVGLPEPSRPAAQVAQVRLQGRQAGGTHRLPGSRPFARPRLKEVELEQELRFS